VDEATGAGRTAAGTETTVETETGTGTETDVEADAAKDAIKERGGTTAGIDTVVELRRNNWEA
jgi:hypothetical protein